MFTDKTTRLQLSFRMILFNTHNLMLFAAMAESRMSSCWVGRRARTRLRPQARPVEFALLSPSWTSSPHRRRTTQNTYWMSELSPPNIMSRLRYHRLQEHLRPVRHRLAPATPALRPPWTRPPLLHPPPGTTSREYSFYLPAAYLTTYLWSLF